MSGLASISQIKRADTHPLLAAQAAAAERLPGLRTVLDKTASLLSQPSRLLAGVDANVSTARVESHALGDLVQKLPQGGIAGLFRLEAWNALLLIALDPELTFSLTDAAFGGNGCEELAGGIRTPSPTDLALARMVLENAAAALQTTLGGIRPARLALERLETRFDRLGSDARRRAVAARMDVTVFGRSAPLWVILPTEVLSTLQQAAARTGTSEASSTDPSWQSRFGGEVKQADVTLTAVIKDDGFNLGAVASFRVGQMLRLHASSAAPVLLESRNQRLFWGTLGQADGRYTVRIESKIGEKCGRPGPEPGGPAPWSASTSITNRKANMSASVSEHSGGDSGVALTPPGLGHVLGIPVTVDVVLGSTTMLVADVMKLGRGAIIPLDGKIGDQVTIAVNGRVVARGEIVVLEDEEFKLGVSLTEVVGSAAVLSGA